MAEVLFGGDEALSQRFEVRRNAVYGISRLTLLSAADAT